MNKPKRHFLRENLISFHTCKGSGIHNLYAFQTFPLIKLTNNPIYRSQDKKSSQDRFQEKQIRTFASDYSKLMKRFPFFQMIRITSIILIVF